MASLKGKSKPVPVVTLGKPLEPRKQQNSEDFFIGRDAEMAILQRCHEQLINGSGGLIEVVGEPGIGKTRLVDEAVAQAAMSRCCAAIASERALRRPTHPCAACCTRYSAPAALWIRTPSPVPPGLRDGRAPELAPWFRCSVLCSTVTIPPSPEVAELEEQHRAERYLSLSQTCLSDGPSPVMLVSKTRIWRIRPAKVC
jgi:hypothetical protein